MLLQIFTFTGKNEAFASKSSRPCSGRHCWQDHSQKQGLLGAIIAGSFESEINRIRVGKSLGFGASCLVAARK